MAKINWKSRFKAMLKISIALAALWFVFSRIPFSEVMGYLSRLHLLPAGLALLLFLASKTLSAMRLNLLFRHTEIHITSRFNLKLYLLGMFYNLFLPGGIGGDGYKIYLLQKKSGVKTKWVFWAVLTDRLMGVMALCLLAVILYYFTSLNAGLWQKWIWLLIPLGLGLSALSLRHFIPRLYPAFLKATGLSILVQLAQVVCAYALLTALGQSSGIAPYLFLFLLSSLVAMLPLTIGGIGSREVTFLLGAEILKLDTGISVTLSLLFYLITLLVSLFGLLFVLKPGELDIKTETVSTPLNLQ